MPVYPHSEAKLFTAFHLESTQSSRENFIGPYVLTSANEKWACSNGLQIWKFTRHLTCMSLECIKETEQKHTLTHTQNMPTQRGPSQAVDFCNRNLLLRNCSAKRTRSLWTTLDPHSVHIITAVLYAPTAAIIIVVGKISWLTHLINKHNSN